MRNTGFKYYCKLLWMMRLNQNDGLVIECVAFYWQHLRYKRSWKMLFSTHIWEYKCKCAKGVDHTMEPEDLYLVSSPNFQFPEGKPAKNRCFLYNTQEMHHKILVKLWRVPGFPQGYIIGCTNTWACVKLNEHKQKWDIRKLGWFCLLAHYVWRLWLNLKSGQIFANLTQFLIVFCFAKQCKKNRALF